MAARALPVGEISEPRLQRALCHQGIELTLTPHPGEQDAMESASTICSDIKMVAKATLVSPLITVLLRKGAPKWKRKIALGNRV